MASIALRKSSSIKTLMRIKDVSKEDAIEIKRIWATVLNRQEAREAIDKVLRTYGVEHLGWHKRKGEHVHYCNAGDTYSTTVLFCGLSLTVGCWGDLVERNLIN